MLMLFGALFKFSNSHLKSWNRVDLLFEAGDSLEFTSQVLLEGVNLSISLLILLLESISLISGIFKFLLQGIKLGRVVGLLIVIKLCLGGLDIELELLFNLKDKI